MKNIGRFNWSERLFWSGSPEALLVKGEIGIWPVHPRRRLPFNWHVDQRVARRLGFLSMWTDDRQRSVFQPRCINTLYSPHSLLEVRWNHHAPRSKKHDHATSWPPWNLPISESHAAIPARPSLGIPLVLEAWKGSQDPFWPAVIDYGSSADRTAFRINGQVRVFHHAQE